MRSEAGLSISAHFDGIFLMVPTQGEAHKITWLKAVFWSFEEMKEQRRRVVGGTELAHYRNIAVSY
jgi:hypothetical protein